MKIIDLHQDLKLSLLRPELLDVAHRASPQTNFSQLASSDVAMLLCTGFPVPNDGDYFKKENYTDLFADIEWYRSYTEVNSEWMMVEDRDDLEACINGEHRGLLFHLEGINMFTGEADDWDKLAALHESGLRSIALTWTKQNSLAGGNDTPEIGITTLGHEVIKWALDNKLIIDLAHLSHAGFADFSNKYDLPILVSHGAAQKYCTDPRNYSDEELKAIGNSGGCFGMFFSKKFVTSTQSCAIEDVIRQINHVRDTAGIDAVAVGSDFGGIVSGTPKDLSSVTALPKLLDCLQQQGWTVEECEKFAYKNALRVLQAYL